MTACHKERDAYFTRPRVARRIWAHALRQCRRRVINPTDVHWIEPSAGAGAFITTKPRCVKRLTCLDIHPLHNDIKRGNFLLSTRKSLGITNAEPVVVIGNPPFGFQGAMVLKFIHNALVSLDAKFVCYVVPPLCVGAHYHNRLLQPIGMSSASPLPLNSFETPDGKPFNLGTAPYVATYAYNAPRLIRMPSRHPDFITNGLHTETANDPRLKHPVPHRFHAIERIRKGGYAFGFSSTTGKIIAPNDMPTEWDDFDGLGGIYLVYANRRRISDAELLRRWKTIHGKAVIASVRKTGVAIGNIAPKHAVQAYNELYGGLDDREQTSLF